MINSISLENFKSFENQKLSLNSLTLLSGLNSTGKSSVLQSLLLLRQSYQQGLLDNIGLALNGDLVRIGMAKDALFEGAKKDSMSFAIECNDSIKGIWKFDYNRESDVMELCKEDLDDKIYKINLFSDRFHYLQAERIGSRTSFEMSDFQVRQHNQIGPRGEYASHFLSLYQDEKISNPLICHESSNSLTLKNQVQAWMGEISPGTQIKLIPNPEMDLIHLQYFYGLSNPYRPTNVGFGVTYVLPILVAVLSSLLYPPLSSPPNTLILLENPEAHLHPKGQAKIGELLALAASCGVQIIVETHSDHVLNGIRLAVHSGKIKPEDVQLHYFDRDEENGQAFTKVISPKIDRNGRIDRWPDGFFDEWRKSLAALI